MLWKVRRLLQGGALTFQTGRVELNEELGAAGRLHDGLDALKLDVGLLRGLGQTCKTEFIRASSDQSGRGEGKSRKSGLQPFNQPFLETNCEVTPTSKVAKTGEWSLVTMSSVQPVGGAGR